MESLILEKDMKLSEVDDIEQEIRKAIYDLEANNRSLSQAKEDLKESEKSGI